MAVAAIPAQRFGKTMRTNTPKCDSPSIAAASSISTGTPSKYPLVIDTTRAIFMSRWLENQADVSIVDMQKIENQNEGYYHDDCGKHSCG